MSNSTYYLMSNLDKKELGLTTIERVMKVMDAYFHRMEDYFVLPRDQKTVLASLGPELEHPVFAGLPEEKMAEIKELMKNFNTLP